MSETRKIAAILAADVVGYSRLANADEDRTLSRLRGLRSDLIDPTIAAHQRPRRQAHWRRRACRVSQRRRRRALRDRSAERHGRTQRGSAAGQAHRVPDRHSSRRRRRGGRRRSDGRWRQYRRAARRHCAAWRDLPVRGRLSAGQRTARSRGHRSRPTRLKNIAEPIRVYSLQVGVPAQAKPRDSRRPEKAFDPCVRSPPGSRRCSS